MWTNTSAALAVSHVETKMACRPFKTNVSKIYERGYFCNSIYADSFFNLLSDQGNKCEALEKGNL